MFVGTGTFTLGVLVYYALTAARQPDIDRYPQDFRDLARSREPVVETLPTVPQPSFRKDSLVTASIETRSGGGAGGAEPAICRSAEP